MRNFFERLSFGGQSPEQRTEQRTEHQQLTAAEQEAIVLRADIRHRKQELKVNAINIDLPGSTDAMKATYQKTLARVHREAEGIPETNNRAEDVYTIRAKAAVAADLFPILAAYHAARAAQISVEQRGDASADLSDAREFLELAKATPKTSPANLLPDAMLLGVQTQLAKDHPLPTQEKIAHAANVDSKFLAQYALAVEEKDRAAFLDLISKDKQREVSAILDASVAPVLHQSLVEKKTPEDAQRMQVRRRLLSELKNTVEKNTPDDRHLVGLLAEAIGSLGDDTRQLLLEIIRDESDRGDVAKADPPKKESIHLPRVLKVFLDNFDDWRGNDIVLRLAGDRRLDSHLSIYLLNKLVAKGYVPKDVGEWWKEEKSKTKIERKVRKEGVGQIPGKLIPEARRLEIVRRVITDLGVMPSRQILEYLADDARWQAGDIVGRVAEVQTYAKEFEKITEVHDLVSILHADAHKAMIYYLLHGGEDRFNLINNYRFDTFKEMLSQIAELRVHETPIKQFTAALTKGSMSPSEVKTIVAKLREGHFPLPNPEQSAVEVSFDVSENAAVKNANMEIGRVLGREQLGCVFLFPLYRKYLEEAGSEEAVRLIGEMRTAVTFADRLRIITEIEKLFPTWRDQAKKELEENWRTLGGKLTVGASLDQVLGDTQVPMRGEELLPQLDTKRFDLKKIKKDLLVGLKGGNKQVADIQKELGKKKKARQTLAEGLARQTEETKRNDLEKKIAAIDNELQSLEQKKIQLGDQKVMEQFAHLTPEEKQKKLDELAKEIIALTEKSPSAIFVYLVAQVLGEDRLREQDAALIKEMESHLQGPFQTIMDATTYQKPRSSGEEKKRMRVRLSYIDKQKRLMHMVRFADSKICCFSSNNYDMVVAHEVPNKLWVASVTADPLSFVIAMETPGGSGDAHEPGAKAEENLGFIFGNFALDDESKLAIMLNGIYYAPGIEDMAQVETILHGVDSIFAGLPIKTTAIASQHGGSLNMPEGYTNDAVALTRLRALDDGSGQPESKIYDDLGTGDGLNSEKMYNSNADRGGNVWHKSVA